MFATIFKQARNLRCNSIRQFSKTSSVAGLKLGDKYRIEQCYRAKDMETFAKLTSDENPIHLDPEYAKSTRFGKCVVYGILANSLAITATQKLLGDGTILVSQNVKYTAPLFVGEKFEATCEIREINKRRVTLDVKCSSLETEKVILEGQIMGLVTKEALL